MEEFVMESISMIQAIMGLILLICFFVLVARVGSLKRSAKEILLIEQYRAKNEGLTIVASCPQCSNTNEGVPGAYIECKSCRTNYFVIKVVESSQTDKTDKV